MEVVRARVVRAREEEGEGEGEGVGAVSGRGRGGKRRLVATKATRPALRADPVHDPYGDGEEEIFVVKEEGGAGGESGEGVVGGDE